LHEHSFKRVAEIKTEDFHNRAFFVNTTVIADPLVTIFPIRPDKFVRKDENFSRATKFTLLTNTVILANFKMHKI